MTDEFKQVLSELAGIVNNFRIRGAGVSGNLREGYTINPKASVGGGTGGGGTPPAVGACCISGTCSIMSAAACTTSGGTYQGDGTICADVDCGTATSGACCVGTSCTIETPTSCAGMGGSYLGDGTVCIPNPCVVECSGPCGFINPDDGLRYLTKTYNNTVDDSFCPPDGFCEPAYPEDCPPGGCRNPYGCNEVFTVKTAHREFLQSESYSLPDCSYSSSNETLAVSATCTHAVEINGTGCDLSCGEPIGGFNICTTLDPDTDPAFFTVCAVVNAEVSYSDLSPCQ